MIDGYDGYDGYDGNDMVAQHGTLQHITWYGTGWMEWWMGFQRASEHNLVLLFTCKLCFQLFAYLPRRM